jgi:alginate O-acetyltransferase complex protein AlgI
VLFTDWKILLGIAIGWCIYYLPAFAGGQVLLLVAGSLAIYAYEAPVALSLLVASAGANAIASFLVGRSESRAARTAWAAAGVALNLLVLAFFKYKGLIMGIFGSQPAGAVDAGGLILSLVLPIGISFYTFHGISLLVDTWRGTARIAPLRQHVGHTYLYLCFFPQLVAGPITKANFFYPQIGPKLLRDIDWDTASSALVTGYFLKLVVANNLAAHTFWLQYPYFVGLPGNELVLLLFGYSIQIFADFAGYSLIAIGMAALFGYRLPANFDFPYLSRSFSEFWTRWHMSLSSWLREYLYVPLGGNRKGRVRTYANLMTVMVLGGLWHGAALSYAIWGAWHGGALAIERMFTGGRASPPGSLLGSLLRWAVVFIVVTLGWLLFKLPEFAHVMAYFEALAKANWQPGLSNRARAILLLSLPVVLYHLHHAMRASGWTLARIKQPAFGAMVFLMAMNGGPDTPFIYFQF